MQASAAPSQLWWLGPPDQVRLDTKSLARPALFLCFLVLGLGYKKSSPALLLQASNDPVPSLFGLATTSSSARLPTTASCQPTTTNSLKAGPPSPVVNQPCLLTRSSYVILLSFSLLALSTLISPQPRAIAAQPRPSDVLGLFCLSRVSHLSPPGRCGITHPDDSASARTTPTASRSRSSTRLGCISGR